MTLLVGSISLILRNEVNALQLALVGNFLANLLLLPGLSVLYATYRRKPLVHNSDTTKIDIMLLYLAVSGFIFPTIFGLQTALSDIPTAAMSRAISVLLIVEYGSFLVFQFCSHETFFEVMLPSQMTELTNTATGATTGAPKSFGFRAPDDILPRLEKKVGKLTASEAQTDGNVGEVCDWIILLIIFAGATVLLYFTVDNIVASIQTLETDHNEFFSGIVLFPVLNCDFAAMEQTDRSMSLMLTYTVGKSVQSAIFIAPMLVIVGWGLGIDALNLSFDLDVVAMIFMAVFLITRLTAVPSWTW